MNFSDPFGLCRQLTDSTQVNECERFAAFVDSVAAGTRSDDQFMLALGELVAGFPGGIPTTNAGRSAVRFGDLGFRDEYIDGDQHPARHFVANMSVGYFGGTTVGNITASVREIWGVCRLRACSGEDVRLGKAGAALGGSLRARHLPRRAVGQWIRDNL